MKNFTILLSCMLALGCSKKSDQAPKVPTHYDSTHFADGSMKILLWDNAPGDISPPRNGDSVVYILSFPNNSKDFGFIAFQPKPDGSPTLYQTIFSGYSDFSDTLLRQTIYVPSYEGRQVFNTITLPKSFVYTSPNVKRTTPVWWKIYCPDSAAYSDKRAFYIRILK